MLIVLLAILLKSRKIVLLSGLILLYFHFGVIAQPPGQYFLQNLDNRNGLSNSAINSIYKDSDNLLWIATWDGLNMYDGTSFHVFNYSKETDSRSIGNNVIQHITEDRQQNIWISTIEGVSRYEKRSGKFYNYFYQQHQRSRISEQEFELAIDTSGKVFCLTQKQGLTLYDPVNDTFQVCAFPRHPSKVRQLAFDPSNRLWLLNNTGELETFTWNGQSFGRLHTWQYPPGIVRFFIVNGRIFFSTTDDQLLEINPQWPMPVPIMRLKQGITAMMNYQGHYLLAWNGKGFGVYDNQFQPSAFLQAEANQMQHIRISSWAAGTEQILWYGTDGNGIIKLYPQTKPFGTVATSDNEMASNRPVRTFCEKDGNLWVGTKGSGIIEIEKFWTTMPGEWKRRYYTATAELDNNAVFALKKGPDSRIYIGTDGKGIGVYDTKEKKFYRWTAIKGYNNYPEFGSVYAILPDKDSSVWLGTSSYGLVHLKLYHLAGHLTVQFLERYTFNNNNTGPANDIIYALAEGDEHQIWIACRYGGLSLLDKRSRRFRNFKAFTYEGSLTNNDVLSLYHDSKNRIWIGTSYGLNRIDQSAAANENPVFQKLTTANGLPNNTIHAIEEDAQGQIWVSTNKGLAKVEPSTLSISYYQQTDGLQSNEFCDGAVWKDPAGYLFMGGIYGFNYFLPQQIRNTDWHPDLFLSNIVMGGKGMHNNSFAVFKPIGKELLSYTVERKDGFFELDVKAISFLNAGKCEYAWYLEGYDQTWHQPGTSGKIAYSNIGAGNYTLKIKWSNGEGLWTEGAPVMRLRVKQYLWLTAPAIMAYILLAALIGYIIYTYRRNRLEIKNQLAVEHLLRVREEELHQGQLGFFTNIAHELQTPLTLIMGSAERLRNSQGSTYASLLHQQASRLTYLVQQLLDFRKAGAGFSNIQYSYLDLSELLTHLTDPFLALSDQQGKSMGREIPQGIHAWMDKDKLEKIVFNLLSNAFKHSGKNTSVLFSVQENTTTKTIEIKVANSGVELTPDQLHKLFDQFYVAPSAGGEKFGTGIGLAFTRHLVEILQGSIEAGSEAGWICFTVKLPLETSGEIDDQAAAQPVSNKPSYLYQSITAYEEGPVQLSAEESNKRAIIDRVQETDKKTILVVEDEPSIRYLLKDVLKDHYIIYEAENGREALGLLDQLTPDCIISDVMMPDMDGLELCTRIKNAPATCQIPFIMLSAKGSIEQRTEGYEVGADAYIAKPFHISHLLVRIRKLLEYRQRLNELFKNNSTIDYTVSDMPDADKQFIDSLVRAIEEHLDDPGLNAAILEKALSLSKMQLYRKLKTMTNMTPGEFIKHIRLKHAAHLLTSSNLTVSEIFYRTGFNNQSYFFREFRKRYQCAPNEYRLQQSAQE